MLTGTSRRLAGTAAVLALGATLLTVTPARAGAALVVNSSADAVPDPADCTGAVTCTLRDAIAITNLAGGSNAVTFASSVTAPVVLSQGALTVSGQSLTVTGNGAALTIIDGNHASVVLSVAAGASLSLSGTTVQHGTGVGVGGIDNRGTTVLTDSVVTGNTGTMPQCRFPPCPVAAGGVHSAGSLTLLRTTIDSNTDPSSSGGGVRADSGDLTVTGSVFTRNSADFAAGLMINSGVTATITASSFTGNTARAWAGGLWNQGNTTVANSTFSGNTSGTSGSVFGWGAGILHVSGSLALTNTTVVSNSATDWAGGLGIWASQTVAVTNSIIADNSPENCRSNGGGVPVASGGSNIENANTCFFTAATDHPNTATGLQGAPTDNGGPVTTLAPLPGSAARNAGDDARCAAAPGGASGVDQRGVPRPQGAHCTIGAVEVDQPAVAISITPPAPAVAQPVTATVTVAPSTVLAGAPQGTVTLVQGGATVGSAAVDSSGTATFSLGALPLGSSTFTASFAATNGFFDATTPAATTVTVKAPVTVTVVAAPPSITAGDTVALTAAVTADLGAAAGATAGATPAPAGTATFFDGSRLLGSATVTSGTAVLGSAGLGAGSHTIWVSYSGDADYLGAVLAASVTVTVSAGAGPATVPPAPPAAPAASAPVPSTGAGLAQEPMIPALASLLLGVALVLGARRVRPTRR